MWAPFPFHSQDSSLALADTVIRESEKEQRRWKRHFVKSRTRCCAACAQHRAVDTRLSRHDLQETARVLGQHFLYANLAHAQTKQDVLELIATQFTFPAHFGKNFDALYDCMTDPLHKAGPQPGFVVVLEQIPATASSTRKRASSCWTSSAMPPTTGRPQDPFRCFYSFL
jgi:hypothetical protein